jgi:small subunit ribosomal protein S24e
MEMQILKEKETPLLSRKRVTLELEATKETPARAELIKAVAAKVKAKEELVIIRHVYSQFGNKTVKVIAHVYKDAKEMAKIERAYLLKKHAQKEEAPAEA